MVKGVKEKSSDLKHFLPLAMREENKGANCMTPEEKKELQRQKRAKKNQEKEKERNSLKMLIGRKRKQKESMRQ